MDGKWHTGKMSPTVEPVPGEPTRFRVHSRSQAGVQHLVDLALNKGSGYCSCAAFAFTCENNIKAGKPLYTRGEPVVRKKKISYPDQTICAHIAQVHHELLVNMLKRIK